MIELLDEKEKTLAERFREHPFAALETYKYFNQTEAVLAEYTDAVIAGDQSLEAPQFTYDELDVEMLLEQRDSLTELLGEFTTERELTLEEKLTRENITNRLDEVGIMLLTKMQSELSEDDPRYVAVSFQLGQNMREVYGTPDEGHFKGILGYRLHQLREVENKDDVPLEIEQAWHYIKLQLPGNLPIEAPYQMRPETRDWYKARLEERLEPARDAVEAAIQTGEIILGESGRLNADMIIQATKIALAARGFEGWEVQLTDAAQIDTSQRDKTIYIPRSRSMDLGEFDRVMQAHEIDEHVGRRENGDASGVEILGGTGLHGYLAFEEGNGKINEGLLSGKINNEASAFGFFVSGGLALGLDRDGQGRNFRQVHELVWRMNAVAGWLKNGKANEDAIRGYIAAGTKHVHRLFRGTDGKVPGVIFPKDSMTYYLGGAEVMRKWDHDMELMEDERIYAHQVERAAKVYPGRRDHRELVEQAVNTGSFVVR